MLDTTRFTPSARCASATARASSFFDPTVPDKVTTPLLVVTSIFMTPIS
jgi:hypothetical protein